MLEQVLDNELRVDAASVWTTSEYASTAFRYSDGARAERYLERALLAATNLSSTSAELGHYIRDWTSEYHLSASRADLLRGFQFRPASRVIEVGCGCGAITRFLGESFATVLGVEGSYRRARLARLRTRDLPNVSVLCAPFQALKFKQAFDHVFCIGVFEYAAMFLTGRDPYDVALEYMCGLLAPGGTLVLAIENQFGLKYWASSREDHTGVRFEGVEGYPRALKPVRTFGYDELHQRLLRYFDGVEFYFPYPDYKTPRCVVSEKFYEKAQVAELIAGIGSRDHSGRWRPTFDEGLALFELDRNRKLQFFANSFLIVAHKAGPGRMSFPQLGVMYTPARAERFRVITRFMEAPEGRIVVKKVLAMGGPVLQEGPFLLRESGSLWVDGLSIQTTVLRRVKARTLTVDDVFAPCRPWLDALRARSVDQGGRVFVSGEWVDRIWKNAYLKDGDVVFVDAEWSWRDPLPLNVVAIRAIYLFLDDVALIHDLNPALRRQSRRGLIRDIARTLGLNLRRQDFSEFCALEAEFTSLVYSRSRRKAALGYRLALDAGWLLVLYRAMKRIGRNLLGLGVRLTSLAGEQSLMEGEGQNVRKLPRDPMMPSQGDL